MKEGQEAIYYITADGPSAARHSPHLEIFRKLGVEVLLMYDRIDEWVASTLTEFDGKPLHSVAKGDLDLGKLQGEEAKPAATTDAEDESLLERIQDGATRSGQRRADDGAADRFAGLPGERRARAEHESGAHSQDGGAERARIEADPGDQSRVIRSSRGSRARPTTGDSPTGVTSSSIRPRSRRADSSKTPQPS